MIINNLHLEVYDLYFNNLADLVDDTRESARSIVVNDKISEVSTLTFKIGGKNEKIKYLNNENIIKYDGQIYKISKPIDSRESDGKTEITIECEHISINLGRLDFGLVEIPADTPVNLINKVLKDTNWVYIGTDIVNEKRHLVTSTETSKLEALLEIAKNFEAVLEFGFREIDNKFTVFLRKTRYNRGLVFEYAFNLQTTSVERNTNEITTRLTMFGAVDKLTDEPINIASINGGKVYLEDYSFYTNQGYDINYIKAHPELFLKELRLEDSSIDDKSELKKVMEEKLKDLSQPQITANFTIANFSDLKGFETEEPKLNEIVYVYDQELNLELESTIIGINKNSDNPLDIDVEVTNAIVYSDRFGNTFNSSERVENLIDSQGKINGIYIKEATIDTLHCKDAFITNAKIDNLAVTSAKIDKAAIGTAHIQQGAVGSVAIAEGAVGNMHISDLNADKLKAGTISTANVKVGSALGEIEITGYQILINDTSDLLNKYNRVILGKYKTNPNDETEEFKYGMVIRGADGKTTMWDENGVHNAGITDGAVDNNKISDNANISGGKIDLNSLIHELNTQEGIEKISGMTIQIDNRSLEVIFKEIESIVNEHENSIKSHNTEIEQTKNDIRLLYESISQIQSGELVGTTITSKNGNIFNGENKETDLILQAFSGTKEITDTIVNERVLWSRNSGNPNLDKIWNDRNIKGKVIHLVADDILNKSTFSAKLLSKQVEGQEQGVISISQITLLDYNDTIVSSVAPTNPTENMLWVDTSLTPNQLKKWNGNTWEVINDTSELEESLGNISNEIYAESNGILKQMEWVKNEIKINQDGIKLKADKTEINSLYNKKYKVRYIREYLNGNSINSGNHWVEFMAFSKGLNILQNIIPTVIIGTNPININYITDGIYSDSTKFMSVSGSNVCIEFDLLEVREDIEFLHTWHYFKDSRTYNGNKVQISSDKVNWITLQDNTNNPYVETEQGNIIPVGLGNVIENYGSRIQNAEIAIEPESITQTVRNSMASEFSNSPNLLEKASRFEKPYWNNVIGQFTFDDASKVVKFNLQNSSGELKAILENPIKLDINSYYCMSIQIDQLKELFGHKVEIHFVLKGDNIDVIHRFRDVSIDNIKNNVLYYQHLVSDKMTILKEISIKIFRKNEVAEETFVTFKCPQFEKRAFPSAWSYPYDIAQADEYSFREQTSKSISEKVSSGDFESYKTQTDREISQKITSIQASDIANQATTNAINNYKELVDKQISDVDKSISDLDRDIKTTFKDGLIDEAEAKIIKDRITQLTKEKIDIDQEYATIYNNKDLSGVNKTNLLNYKNSYNTAHTNLINSINVAIADNKITAVENTDVTNKTNALNTALKNFKKAFNEAIDYIGSEKISNIKIGGKNLIKYTDFSINYTSKYKIWGADGKLTWNSSEKCLHYQNTSLVVNNAGVGILTPQILTGLKKETEYILSFKARSAANTGVLDYIYIISNEQGVANQKINVGDIPINQYDSWENTQEIKFKSGANYSSKATILIGFRDAIIEGNVNLKGFKIKEIQLEEGNKRSQWNVAQEDLKEEINDVNKALGGLEDDIKGAFRDGIIDETEAKIIKDRIEQLNKEKKDIDKQYDTVYSNANLVGSPKTNLYNAKVEFNSKHTNLINSINVAIADNKITAVENTDVTNKTRDYSNAISLFSQRFQEALDSITTVKTDKIKIGVENLFVNTDFSNEENVKKWYCYPKQNNITKLVQAVYSFGNNDDKDKFLKGKAFMGFQLDIAKAIAEEQRYGGANLEDRYVILKPNTDYVLSWYGYLGGSCLKASANVWGDNFDDNFVKVAESKEQNTYTGMFEKQELKFNSGDKIRVYIRFYNYFKPTLTTGRSDYNIMFPQLEEGTKSTDWKPNQREYVDKFSEIKQTADGIKMDVKATQGSLQSTNLIKNSTAKIDLKGWDSFGSCNIERITDFKNHLGKAHFIKLTNEGDCQLIQDGEKNILIDCGQDVSFTEIKKYLDFLNIKKIDLFIVTHFHADHMGSYAALANEFEILEVIYKKINLTLLDKIEPESEGYRTKKFYNDFLTKSKEKLIKIREVKNLEIIRLSEYSSLKIINANCEDYSSYNNISLGVLYKCFDKKIMFSGDMTHTSERNCGGDIGRVDVLKAGHHCYNRSVSENYIVETNPDIVIATTPYITYENKKECIGTIQWKEKGLYDTGTNGNIITTITKTSISTTNIKTKYLIKNTWWKRLQSGSYIEWVWFQNDGTIAKNKEVLINNKYYKFDRDGICLNP